MKHLKYFGGYIITTLVSITLLFLAINRLVVFSKLTTSDIEIANALTSAIIVQILITAFFAYTTYHLMVDSVDMYRLYKKERRLVLKSRVRDNRQVMPTHRVKSTCTLTHADKAWLMEEPKPDGDTIEVYDGKWIEWYQRGTFTLTNFDTILLRIGNAQFGSARLIKRLRDEYEHVL